MCGLCGVILGRKRRRRTEIRQIAGLFTELLLDSQIRGTDAAGVAVVRRDGSYKLFKRPGPAALLVEDKLYGRVVSLDNKVTAVLGHTRRKTRGSEHNSRNNHPIVVGRLVCGTHNGTLANADHLASTLRLRRAAEVDSEVLFRLAERSRSDTEFRSLLARCRGRISAAFVRLDEPPKLRLLKGDMPLHAAHVPRMRAVLYASEPWMLQTALQDLSHEMLALDPFTLLTFDTADVLDFHQTDVFFRTPEVTRCLNPK
jgi:glucosamine 6-phosphate synthetase-like amidotransferase/phosphosugar isomerase protein